MSEKDETKSRNKNFPFDYPFEYKGEEIDALTFRRPTMDEVKAMAKSPKNGFEDLMDMMAELSGRPVEMIGKIDAEDGKKIQVWLNGILGK